MDALAKATRHRRELTADELATAEAAWDAWLIHARRAVHARLSAAVAKADTSLAREDVEYAQGRPGAAAPAA